MNISKFFLIEAALVIAVIPLLFLLQGKNKKSPLVRSSNKEDLLEKTSIYLPNKKKILELEKLAKNQGSGIEFDLLVGNWKFMNVWKKGTDEEDFVFSSLLRIFSANLELKKSLSNDHPFRFSIGVSIEFGIISIKFSGNGYLKGNQPLLPFIFNLIELKSGSSILLSKTLEEPVEKDTSFFELISSGESGKWLSARGQGGGLILWLKD